MPKRKSKPEDDQPLHKMRPDQQKPQQKPPTLEKVDFNAIKFTHSQLNFFKTIRDNFLTVCTGPAGCLTKNEKIRGYIVKSKKMTRNIHEESSDK